MRALLQMRFWRARRGVAAVEFALVFPLLVALLLGAMAGFDSIRASRMITRSATIVADLATRVEYMDKEIADGIYAAAVAVAGSYGDGNKEFTIVISSVSKPNDAEALDLTWSISNQSGRELSESELHKFRFPEIAPLDSVILVTVSAPYTPFITTDAFGAHEFSSTQVRRPRFVREVEWVD